MADWDSSRYFYALTLDRLKVLAHLPPAEQVVLIYFADRQRNPNRRGVALSLDRYALDCWRDLLSIEAFEHTVRSLEKRGFLVRTLTDGHFSRGTRGRRVFFNLNADSPLVIDSVSPFLRFTANERIWLLTKLMKNQRARLRGCCLTAYWYLALRSRHTKLKLRGITFQYAVEDLTLETNGTRDQPFTTNAFKMAVRRLTICGLIKSKVKQRDGRIRYVTETPTGDFLTWRDEKRHAGIERERFVGYFGADGLPLPRSLQPDNRIYAYKGQPPARTQPEQADDSDGWEEAERET